MVLFCVWFCRQCDHLLDGAYALGEVVGFEGVEGDLLMWVIDRVAVDGFYHFAIPSFDGPLCGTCVCAPQRAPDVKWQVGGG